MRHCSDVVSRWWAVPGVHQTKCLEFCLKNKMFISDQIIFFSMLSASVKCCLPNSKQAVICLLLSGFCLATVLIDGELLRWLSFQEVLTSLQRTSEAFLESVSESLYIQMCAFLNYSMSSQFSLPQVNCKPISSKIQRTEGYICNSLESQHSHSKGSEYFSKWESSVRFHWSLAVLRKYWLLWNLYPW